MRAALALAVIAAGPAAADGSAAGDPAAGRELAVQCRTCHGLDGVAKIPLAPHIGGEPADYLAAQLRAFRSGARESEMMSVVAGSLSDSGIADLAAWYASLEPRVSPPERDAAVAPEACVACHGADGLATVEGAPHLAGESEIYLLSQLEAFQSGARESETMTPIAKGLSEDAARAAAAWDAASEVEAAR